ncbi:hypothetical protein V5734_16650 [Defluviimonas sp. SAOS-178_SWC]
MGNPPVIGAVHDRLNRLYAVGFKIAAGKDDAFVGQFDVLDPARGFGASDEFD